jgi:[CysO sulfur-carrier protein]-S-L-cysteine hydrolase
MINQSLPGPESEPASRQTVPASSADRLCLPEPIRERILVHLLEATPNEGVGLLAVSPPVTTDAGGWETTAVRFFPGTNIEASPSRFTMDPVEVIAAFREIRETGWLLGAIVHSHVTGPATPSTTDLREARYPEALLMIVSFADQPAHVRVWRVAQEDDLRIVQPVTIEVLQHE